MVESGGSGAPFVTEREVSGDRARGFAPRCHGSNTAWRRLGGRRDVKSESCRTGSGQQTAVWYSRQSPPEQRNSDNKVAMQPIAFARDERYCRLRKCSTKICRPQTPEYLASRHQEDDALSLSAGIRRM
jgi:hypothetical protein